MIQSALTTFLLNIIKYLATFNRHTINECAVFPSIFAKQTSFICLLIPEWLNFSLSLLHTLCNNVALFLATWTSFLESTYIPFDFIFSHSNIQLYLHKILLILDKFQRERLNSAVRITESHFRQQISPKPHSFKINWMHVMQTIAWLH